MRGYVYILESLKNGKNYIGSSTGPGRRLSEFHNMARVKATALMVPWKIVFVQEYSTIAEARKIEYWIKRQKDKDFIKRIINEGKILKSFG